MVWHCASAAMRNVHRYIVVGIAASSQAEGGEGKAILEGGA